ncbi:MAG: ATPase domain-containing protein, partial [Gammaproteobacteria bacterium]
MTSDKAKIRQLATGVAGLDRVLGGGLPEFSFNLLAGAPGSGKTTLAHQIMFALATPERPALYFTVLGEPPLKMLRYQQQFEFFTSDKVNRSIRFISLEEDMFGGDLGKVLGRITSEVAELQPALVFIDSFRSIALAGSDRGNGFLSLQQFIQQLGMLMTSWQATTFLVGEYISDHEPSPIVTVADGLIWLRQSVQRSSVVRKMEIVKMRGQATLPGLHTFRINSAGIHVFSPFLSSRTATRAAVPGGPRLRLGVPGLDEMMGGGLPQGYSLLVAGPSGSGKSILASRFLLEGARGGETGIIAAFEQHPEKSCGPEIAALVESGRIAVLDMQLLTLSVDEVATQLMEEIRRLKATRVVIDSLSGFELALAPAFREDFRESLALMMSALASIGVTVLMTSELEDRYTELSFSPYGTAFLTDAIIIQRYVEIDGRLERILAVVKVRASAHSNELRLYHI